VRSMLEEIEVPKPPRFHQCPCCHLGFKQVDDFKAHLQRKLEKLNKAMAELEKTK